MYQAIVTKYLGPTNHRSGRVKATAAAGSATIAWDHALSISDNHARAAKALALRYGWDGEWLVGGLPGGGNVYVLATDHGDGFTIANRGEK